ncbi:hypothetical protein DH2020_008672 [Rehmannia glutinosa]|uniref:RRM domain-containing protein n=1 Tax=Rehmannia glutinosa TaxID=99300 RepID=A0ABR0X793_REHGL
MMMPPQHQPAVQTQPPQFWPQQQQQHYGAAPTNAAAAAPASGGAEEVRSLWIGDLQYWMDENYLTSCFYHTGEERQLLSAKVIRNKQTGQSEGYGFLEFRTRATAENILQTYNGAMMPNSEQTFRLNWASLGGGDKRTDDSPEHTIFVGDLAGDVTDYVLQETFKAVYQSVKGAKVVTDRTTGRQGPMRIGPAANKKPMNAPTQTGEAISREERGSHLRGPGTDFSLNDSPIMRGLLLEEKLEHWERVDGEIYLTVYGFNLHDYLSFAASYQNAQGNQGESDPNNTTIFVGGLDPMVTDDLLRQVFSQYGDLVHVKIPVGKRCGFVQFADRSCAEQALGNLNGTVLGGQNIRLSWGRSPSNKQSDQSQWGGGGGGYYGGGYTQGYEAHAAGDMLKRGRIIGACPELSVGDMIFA